MKNTACVIFLQRKVFDHHRRAESAQKYQKQSRVAVHAIFKSDFLLAISNISGAHLLFYELKTDDKDHKIVKPNRDIPKAVVNYSHNKVEHGEKDVEKHAEIVY